jgi:cell wall-associated NlpC family hydrolase
MLTLGVNLRARIRQGSVLIALVAITAPIVALPSAQAAQSLQQVQARVRQLQEEAASAAEGAQEAKVKLASLNRTLAGIQAKEEAQSKSVDALSKTLSAIAIEQYKTGGLSQSLELLFSSDPGLYLSAAGSLEAITRKKSGELRKFQAAKQKLTATSLTVNDKLSLVKAEQKKLAAQSAQAKAKLAEAESLLAKLKKEDRIRLELLAQQEEDADQASSLAAAKSASAVSGRAGKALQFAFKQIGDRYVFGAAGMTYWDCSGLTMRAYQNAGVSLPHSSRAQYGYGKAVKRANLAPGDLVFFGRPISHVGIYVGGGKMVHAPHPGSRVKVASAYSLGRKPYIGARRL